MIYLLCGALVALLLIACALLFKIASMHRAADELRAGFAARLLDDTNVGLDISTADRQLRLLAADMDKQLRLLRKKRLRYEAGDRALYEAVTNISHDLRTPLTAICGYMELLEREDAPETVKRHLSVIASRAEVMKQLTEELLRHLLFASENHYANRETVDINLVLEESLAASYGALAKRGITPQIAAPEHAVKRQLNMLALRRILDNILENVVKYGEGDLVITLSDEGILTFCNHASALDEVAVGRLFDRFYTVESGQSGTGLGLFIAKSLTEQMGGRIGAKIEKGLFTVELSF